MSTPVGSLKVGDFFMRGSALFMVISPKPSLEGGATAVSMTGGYVEKMIGSEQVVVTGGFMNR